MDLYAFPPIAALLDGAYAVLMGLADLLEPVAGASSAAAAVVLLTLLVRAALIPVGISQAKAERTRARLAPKLAELQRKHGKDPERLQRETMALYEAEGTTPFAGCLPMLLQAPVVGIIYALFILPTIAGHPNALLAQTLFGVPLGSSLAGSVVTGIAVPATLAVFGTIVLAIALVGELTRRVFRPQPTPPPAAAGAASAPVSPLSNPDTLRMLGFLQFATAVIAMFVPLAAALYLLVTVAWTLAQRVLLRRVYPLPEVRTA
ncbi:YidC/Oxa1 family membrane protein insertase [Agromyces ramosus]|uniref:Membrane protein insertase YidC n=1 Tax=Agromyces ramosus TaxID=33879 RepID=A0ABU0R5E7_9MICO|nr:membrane protein insertase YidC [Agromyces ramosus]MDQ0893301.1 YidC/Oxa1 family membrane protein insertase [Agromyces ramosus]